jgi:hypothetical protein
MLPDHGLWNLVRTEFNKKDIKKEEIKRSEELYDHRIRKLTYSAGNKQAQYFTEEDLMVKVKILLIWKKKILNHIQIVIIPKRRR